MTETTTMQFVAVPRKRFLSEIQETSKSMNTPPDLEKLKEAGYLQDKYVKDILGYPSKGGVGHTLPDRVNRIEVPTKTGVKTRTLYYENDILKLKEERDLKSKLPQKQKQKSVESLNEASSEEEVNNSNVSELLQEIHKIKAMLSKICEEFDINV